MAVTARLSSIEIDRLLPYADGTSLASFRARTRAPWSWIPRVLGAGAVTLGSNVAFRAGLYDPTTPHGLALIAHECIHVRQYRQMGFLPFLIAYARGAVASRFVHNNHPLELEPEAVQARVYAELQAAQP